MKIKILLAIFLAGIFNLSDCIAADNEKANANDKKPSSKSVKQLKRDAASGLATGKRDAASGLPTGKRQHKPISTIKELDKSSPSSKAGYRLCPDGTKINPGEKCPEKQLKSRLKQCPDGSKVKANKKCPK